MTGATGTVGRELVPALRRLQVPVREAVTDLEGAVGGDRCRFAFEDSDTWDPALDGVDRVLQMRPPAISDVKGVIRPFIQHLALQPIRQVVVLSLMGVNPAMPHWHLERDVKASGLPWTMLRPALFMQNLQSAYRDDIRDHDRIRLPAGRGRTSFIDTRDMADVATVALTQPEAHAGNAYTLTGGQALSWTQVRQGVPQPEQLPREDHAPQRRPEDGVNTQTRQDQSRRKSKSPDGGSHRRE